MTLAAEPAVLPRPGLQKSPFHLTPAQVQELSASRYYVQLHSEKAPDGNLWGWLMPQQEKGR